MSDVEVVTADLRSAAAALAQVRSAVAGARPEEAMDSLPGALPGSQSSAIAGAVAGRWISRFKDWDTGIAGQHDALTESAATYDGTDACAAAAMSSLGGRATGAEWQG